MDDVSTFINIIEEELVTKESLLHIVAQLLLLDLWFRFSFMNPEPGTVCVSEEDTPQSQQTLRTLGR